MDGDASFGGAAPAPGDRAAVCDRREHGGVQVSGVDEPWHAAGHQPADLAGELVAAGDDVVSPSARTRSSLLGEASAITVRPRAAANWMAYSPTAPAAPVTATTCPAFRSRASRARWAATL